MLNRRGSVILISVFITIVSTYVVGLGLLSRDSRVAGINRLWRSYYALVFTDQDAAAEAVTHLNRAGFETLSYHSTEFEFTTFSSTEHVALSDLKKRFSDADPRFDPYMRHVEAYFRPEPSTEPSTAPSTAPSTEIVYLRHAGGPISVRRDIRQALPNELTWSLPEWAGMEFVATIVGSVIVVGLVALWSGRSALYLVGAGLPWIAFSVIAGPMAAPAAGPALLGWAFLLECLLPVVRDKLSYGFGAGLAGCVPAIGGGLLGIGASVLVALFAGLSPGLYVVTAVLGVLGTAVVFGADVIKGAFREHHAFLPVPMTNKRPPSLMRATVVAGLIAVCFAVPFVANSIGPVGAQRVPAPVAGRTWDGEAFTLDNLSILGGSQANGDLPNIADYVTHVAYQQGLTYGREYALPAEGEELRLPRFRYEGARVIRYDETVVRYTDEWLRGALGGISGGVEALLLSQDAPVRVVLRPMVGIYFDENLLLRQMLIILLGLLPFLGHALAPALKARNGLYNVSPRRNRQEA